MKGNIKQTSEQKYEQTTVIPARPAFTLDAYQDTLRKRCPGTAILQFHGGPHGLGNLEYVIAAEDEDIAGDSVPSLLVTPEERAFLFLNSLKDPLFYGLEPGSSLRFFLKHTLQSRLGTHCVFGARYQGFEVDEHAFVVHVDKSNRVVMLCATYLPRLPDLLQDRTTGEFRALSPEEMQEQEKRIQAEVDMIGEYDHVDEEKLWLVIWDEQKQAYQVVPGNQVKLSLPKSKPKDSNAPTVVRIPAGAGLQPLRSTNAPGLADEQVGLGEIVHTFLTAQSQALDVLDDDHIRKVEATLRSLESGAELRGRYAAIKDEIDIHSRDKKGIFVNELETKFDRVTAYYYLDYIQRYFREALGFGLLDRYAHLNPVQIVLARSSDEVATYDVNGEQIKFYQLPARRFTAVRDPRLVYHEFVHVVTDALARLHRAGRLIHPRAAEALQAQAMDEGLADYFAASLAGRQGATRPLAYYEENEKWVVKRNLNPIRRTPGPEPTQVASLTSRSRWNEQKYGLGEQWGRYLWQVRKSLGPQIADTLIAYSIFFLTRWATFKQGIDAIVLADRLLFGGLHRQAIENPGEAIEKIQFI